MSTPQQPNKPPRRSARKQKPTNTPNGPHPQGAVSDNELLQVQVHNNPHLNGNVIQSRPQSQTSHQKPNGVTHRGSISDSIHSGKAKATPIKQAYAGPTFHQSPAASALPMPSFYSRSVPSAAANPPRPISEQGVEGQHDNSPKQSTPTNKESTPLDFLFEAARQARGTPRGESPGSQSGHLSIRNGSPASKSPASRDPDSMFPFELDGGSTPGEDGSSFATPYRDRIEALRGGRPSSEGSQSMDENERKAKTDALKRLLMRSAGSQDSRSSDTNNPFNARAVQSTNQLTSPPSQIRHRSGPSTPSYMQTYNGCVRGDQYFPQMPHLPNHGQNDYAAYRVASNLRNVYGASSEPEPAELSSDSAITPPRISTARKPSYTISPPPNIPTLPQTGPATRKPHGHKAKPSVQQMEDDLRRVLKLDLASPNL